MLLDASAPVNGGLPDLEVSAPVNGGLPDLEVSAPVNGGLPDLEVSAPVNGGLPDLEVSAPVNGGLPRLEVSAPDDWRMLRAARLAALRDSPHAFTSTYAREAAWGDLKWRRLFKTSTWVVAREAQEVIGLAKSVKRPWRPSYRHVESVWVAPTHRRRGVLRALLYTLAETCRPMGSLSFCCGFWTTIMPRGMPTWPSASCRRANPSSCERLGGSNSG